VENTWEGQGIISHEWRYSLLRAAIGVLAVIFESNAAVNKQIHGATRRNANVTVIWHIGTQAGLRAWLPLLAVQVQVLSPAIRGLLLFL
jgi:hypothetical protein